MMRRKLSPKLGSAIISALLIFASIPFPITLHSVAVAQDTALPPSASGMVRVVFADSTVAGLGDAHGTRGDRPVRVFERDPGQDIWASIRRWKSVPGVIDARPEIIAKATIDDSYWSDQWNMNATSVGSSRAETAWTRTTGSNSVVVAVLDTGQTSHPDLEGALQEGWGADMVATLSRAGDGNGRDTDPSDTGDWCDSPASPSSWHGTHVAGIIAAQHNAIGVRGVAPNVNVMHVRVLGHCGGELVDIVDGIRWAAGLTTDYLGYPWAAPLSTNPNPADVINLSLGGTGSCQLSWFGILRDAISAARAAGSIVVVAAGNESVDVRYTYPAGCPEAFTVAATGPNGGRASYSNYGAGVDLAAPGGDITDIMTAAEQGILSTVEIKTVDEKKYVADREPTDIFGYAFYDGTSMAAPHVAGAAALLRSIWPSATVADVESELRLSARVFPSSCNGCGAGLLDIGALVARSPQDELSIDNDPPLVFGVGVKTTVPVTGGSGGGAITVTTTTPTYCTTSGATVTGRASGTCEIRVTKSRSSGFFAATSAALAVPVVVVPKSTRAPKLTLAANKLSVTVNTGTWSTSGSVSYSWYRCENASKTNTCMLIADENQATYQLRRPADVGKYLRAQVTMTSNGFSVSAWSNSTAKIRAL